MEFTDLSTLFDANKTRLSVTRDYLNRYNVDSKEHVSTVIRGYSDARKADLVLIPNNFEGEIVDNQANWAFGRGFMINSKDEKDYEFLQDFVTSKNLNVIAKRVAKYALATGAGLLTAYTDAENIIRFYVPEPDKTIYLQNSFGDIERFAFFYWKEELKGWRLYCDAFDENEITYFKSVQIQSSQMFINLPSMEVISSKPHNFKKAPATVVDIMRPAFYRVIPLIDAYNKLITETNDQFSAFKAVMLALRNLIMTDDLKSGVLDTEEKNKQALDKIQKMSVFILGEDGDANFMKREVQVEAFTAIEGVISKNIDRFSGNINYSDPEVMGRATNLAINTRTKPISNKAQDITDVFQEQFRKLLEIINDFWKIQGKAIQIEKVSFEFNYDKPSNQVEEATTVQTLRNSGVPKLYAFQQFSGFTDPALIAKEADEEEEKENAAIMEADEAY